MTTLYTMAGLRAAGTASPSQLVSCRDLGGQSKGRGDPEMALGAGTGPQGWDRERLKVAIWILSFLDHQVPCRGSPESITDQEVVYGKADAWRSKDFHVLRKEQLMVKFQTL